VRQRSRWTTAALLVLAASCSRASGPDVATGRRLFSNCARCHGALGGGSRALGAPAIAGLPQWYVQAQLEKFRAGHRGYAPFDTSGIRMKSVAWTLGNDTSLASLALYVSSLAPAKPAPVLHGDAQAGQAAFQVCQACHGPNAMGNEAMHAPPLALESDWYLLAQLRKFKAGWRGTDTADIWGMTMRPNAVPLDEAGMANVVAYIQTRRGAAGAP
jgi:cytochrome c553